jgi:Fe2+ or Zn2+ uptake regulation protein
MNWTATLSEKGYRITTPRRAIMGALEELPRPASPTEILERGRRHHPDLGLVTVYRALALFADLGLVRRVHRQDGCHAYLLASPGHTHAAICYRCGQAIEFPGGDDLIELIARVERQTGFCVESHLLQLFGHCEHCEDNEG